MEIKAHILYQLDLIHRKNLMDEMIKKISVYPNGTFLKINWEYGKVIIEGIIDTIYETNNGLDEDEDGYQEFYACAVMIKKVINMLEGEKVNVNELIEISNENQPTSIELEDGTIIWENVL